METQSGLLYVVATPIGNLEDISARALRILREVDAIAAEDTRHTSQLLSHFAIATPLFSLHEHNEQARVAQIITRLREGQTLALVSDAGTPLISDPGFPVVRELRRAGLRVLPVPGASSIVAALSVAGLPTDRFVFEGFLSSKSAARRTRLKALSGETRTLIFLEASHRIRATLGDLQEIFGSTRLAVVARELTKRFEQIHSAPLGELIDWLESDPDHCRGEFVLLVHGAANVDDAVDTPANRRLLSALLEHLPMGRAVAVAAKASGLQRNALYQLALTLSQGNPAC